LKVGHVFSLALITAEKAGLFDGVGIFYLSSLSLFLRDFGDVKATFTLSQGYAPPMTTSQLIQHAALSRQVGISADQKKIGKHRSFEPRRPELPRARQP
jgi:hypothetical protein